MPIQCQGQVNADDHSMPSQWLVIHTVYLRISPYLQGSVEIRQARIVKFNE